MLLLDFMTLLPHLEIDNVLTPATPFPKTTLEEVMGCLAYPESPKTLEKMEAEIEKGVELS